MATDYGITLDKSRNFSTVHPPENGAHYFQDGVYFDSKGVLVDDMLDATMAKRLERLKAKKIADAAADKARKAAYDKAGLDGDAVEKELAPQSAKDTGDVDLLAWAQGTKLYRFGQVREAMQKIYSVVAPDAATAIEFMIDNGHIARDLVNVRY